MRNRRISTIAGVVTGLAMLTGSVAYGTGGTTDDTSTTGATSAHAPGLLDNAAAIYAELVVRYEAAVEAARVAAAEAEAAAADAAAAQVAAEQAAAAAAAADQAARDAAAALEAQAVENPAPVDPTVDPADDGKDGDCGLDGSRDRDRGEVRDGSGSGFGGGHRGGGHGHHGGGR